MCESGYIFYYEASQIQNINRMSVKTLDDSLRLATTNIGIDIGTIVSEKHQPQALH